MEIAAIAASCSKNVVASGPKLRSRCVDNDSHPKRSNEEESKSFVLFISRVSKTFANEGRELRRFLVTKVVPGKEELIPI